MSKVLGQDSLLAIKSWSEGKFAEKATTLAGYGITDAYTKTEIDGKVSGALHYKGTVATYSNLPVTGQVQGDVYNITNADPTHGIRAGDNVAWTGTEWDVLGGVVDLSAYVTTTALNTTLADYLLASTAASTYVAKETGKSLVADTEITKLSGVTAGAEPNVLEGVQLNGTDLSIVSKKVNIPVMTGAAAATAGALGLVPAPAAGDDTKFLSGDGTWKTVSVYNLPIASASTLGGVKVGTNLSIDGTGVLSATDTTYTGDGTSISISAGNVISAVEFTQQETLAILNGTN